MAIQEMEEQITKPAPEEIIDGRFAEVVYSSLTCVVVGNDKMKIPCGRDAERVAQGLAGVLATTEQQKLHGISEKRCC